MKLKNILKNILFLKLCLFLSSTIYSQIGIYTVQGNLTKTSGTTYIELKNLSGPGIGHDQISVSGNAEIGGFLNITLNGYSPSNNHHFEILTFVGNLTGTFALVTFPPSMSTWNIDYGILNPGKITIYGPSSLLPVKLISFTAKPEGTNNVLSWKTATEVNNAYFDVENSINGIKFNKIGEVPSLVNSSSITQVYEFIDKGVSKEVTYYRLRQVDIDGKWEYSPIVSVINKGNERELLVYPNPTSGDLLFSDEVHFVEIYNIMGEKVISSVVDNQKININHLPEGHYTVRLNKSTESTKILKLN